jgi:hypothetical protein
VESDTHAITAANKACKAAAAAAAQLSGYQLSAAALVKP